MQLRNSYTTLGSVKCKPLPLPRSNGPYHLSSVGCKRKLEGRSCGHVRAVADDRGYLLADADVVERVLRYPDGQVYIPLNHFHNEFWHNILFMATTLKQRLLPKDMQTYNRFTGKSYVNFVKLLSILFVHRKGESDTLWNMHLRKKTYRLFWTPQMP